MQKMIKAWKEYGVEMISTLALVITIGAIGWAAATPYSTTAYDVLPASEIEALKAEDASNTEDIQIIQAPVNVGIYDIPEAATGFKAWEPYTAITCTTSAQYRLQEDAWTDGNGFRRYGNEGYYMVAMGTYYAEECGKVFDVTFESGTTIRCIVGDIKANEDTDELNMHCRGNVVEFIVDKSFLNEDCLTTGDMSYAKGVDLTGKPTLIRQIEV